LKPLLLPLGLIMGVSALLLYMDQSGRDSDPDRLPRVAIAQFASQSALDDSVQGIESGLANRGYVDGHSIIIERFNAQGDMPTANDIARRITDGTYDLIITSSTASLQTVANVNRQSKVPHVFGIVTDPTVIGIGYSATDPLDHPPYMAGYGSFASVDDALRLARTFNPSLRRIGLVWHTAEANSLAYTEATRAATAALGMELLEANAETSSAVGEAAASLTARGVDALLVTGDVVVLVAIDAVVAAAQRAGVPVISVIPPNARSGALFDLGADFTAIGTEIGELAADVLGGLDPATVPLENRVPEQLILNLVALERVASRWRLPPGLEARAAIVIDNEGIRRNPEARYRAP
jgi:putative tryptophan/tyrosine transport system substrate-binding protein